MQSCLLLDVIFHAIAFSLDDDGIGMMKQPVEKRRSEGTVVVEDAGPLLERTVGSDDDSALLVALTDDLEEQIRAVLIDGQIAQFINEQ